jgi:hypothetical protein
LKNLTIRVTNSFIEVDVNVRNQNAIKIIVNVFNWELHALLNADASNVRTVIRQRKGRFQWKLLRKVNNFLE